MYNRQFINLYKNRGFSFEDAKSEIDFALDVLFGYKYNDFLLGKPIEKWQAEKLKKIFEERTLTHRPIQQIIGQAFFFGRKFFVDNSTLIPRPETELLAEEAVNILKNFPEAEILDIGTGTGCIPITIYLELNNNVKIDAVDISSQTLETAGKNKLFHNIFNGIEFIKSDLFENVECKYDVIISNPPYIPLKIKDTLDVEVKDFEPYNALFTNDDLGIEFYIKIIDKVRDYLKDNGYVLFELGINQGGAVKNYLEENNFKNIKLIKDLNSIDRVIIFQK